MNIYGIRDQLNERFLDIFSYYFRQVFQFICFIKDELLFICDNVFLEWERKKKRDSWVGYFLD